MIIRRRRGPEIPSCPFLITVRNSLFVWPLVALATLSTTTGSRKIKKDLTSGGGDEENSSNRTIDIQNLCSHTLRERETAGWWWSWGMRHEPQDDDDREHHVWEWWALSLPPIIVYGRRRQRLVLNHNEHRHHLIFSLIFFSLLSFHPSDPLIDIRASNHVRELSSSSSVGYKKRKRGWHALTSSPSHLHTSYFFSSFHPPSPLMSFSSQKMKYTLVVVRCILNLVFGWIGNDDQNRTKRHHSPPHHSSLTVLYLESHRNRISSCSFSSPFHCVPWVINSHNSIHHVLNTRNFT